MPVTVERIRAIEVIASQNMPEGWTVSDSNGEGDSVRLRIEREGDYHPYWVHFTREALDDALFLDDGAELSETGREWLVRLFRRQLGELQEGAERIFRPVDIR